MSECGFGIVRGLRDGRGLEPSCNLVAAAATCIAGHGPQCERAGATADVLLAFAIISVDPSFRDT
ncbi:MAG: hypothetical protein JWN70_6459 [Planctomycetaceae bacterium]|nr:hypothetical protein [Planctomycetaceae bacterium]